MARFSQAARGAAPQQKPRPPKIIRLEPSAFVQTWERNKGKAVAVGLRGVSDGDESTARAEAEKLAREEFEHEDPENLLDCFNDAIMRMIVARGICDPNDATKPHPLFELADDVVRAALPSATVRYLFEEIEKLQVETSPLHPEASAEEVEELAAMLTDPDVWSRLPAARCVYVRRYLRFALEELRGDSTTEPVLSGMDPELAELLM